jgi:hypothetical protein
VRSLSCVANNAAASFRTTTRRASSAPSAHMPSSIPSSAGSTSSRPSATSPGPRARSASSGDITSQRTPLTVAPAIEAFVGVVSRAMSAKRMGARIAQIAAPDNPVHLLDTLGSQVRFHVWTARGPAHFRDRARRESAFADSRLAQEVDEPSRSVTRPWLLRRRRDVALDARAVTGAVSRGDDGVALQRDVPVDLAWPGLDVRLRARRLGELDLRAWLIGNYEPRARRRPRYRAILSRSSYIRRS